jgi:hypothetical protein
MGVKVLSSGKMGILNGGNLFSTLQILPPFSTHQPNQLIGYQRARPIRLHRRPAESRSLRGQQRRKEEKIARKPPLIERIDGAARFGCYRPHLVNHGRAPLATRWSIDADRILLEAQHGRERVAAP